MALHQKVSVFQGTPEDPFPVAEAGIGSSEYPFRAFVKCDAAGAVLAASPDVGAAGRVISVVRNGAGDYTVTLAGMTGVAAANLACMITSNTAGVHPTAVITDATHIAVAGETDAGAATDCAFTLEILVLGTP